MNYTIPTLSIVFMSISCLIGFAIPFVLFIVFRKRYKADVLPFFIGSAVFILFVLLLERSVHNLILSSAVGKAIMGNIWIYGIYGGLMAGLFEEIGRFTAFKTVLRKNAGKDQNALMYGAGHGGFETLYLLGGSMISNIVMSITLNKGMGSNLTAGITDPTTLQSINATIKALAEAAPIDFLVGSIERFAAVAFHISLSVLVWFSAKKELRRFYLLPLAIFLHALMDTLAIILSHYISNIWVIEAVVYGFSACSVLIALVVWRKYSTRTDPIAEIETV
ncbi:MAG: hypothetical protein PWQ55_2116 [Chloroflexota bacterium]|nr:hypothetical protein [Chloroflexota bacterium]